MAKELHETIQSENPEKTQKYHNKNTELFEQYLQDKARGVPLAKSKAREELVQKNKNLIYKVMKKFHFDSKSSFYSMDDVFSMGMIGLIRAVDSFDPSKEVNFSTFAIQVIYNEFALFLRHKSNSISPDSIDELSLGEDENLSISYYLEDPDQQAYFENSANQDVIKSILSCLNHFPIKHQDIFCRYYGLAGFEECKNQRKIGESIHWSQSHVLRIIKDMEKEISGLLKLTELPSDYVEQIYGFHPAVYKALFPKDKEQKGNHIREGVEIKNYKNFRFFSESEQELFCVYYGLIDTKRLPVYQIAKKFNITNEQIFQVADYMKEILRLLDSDPETLTAEERNFISFVKRQNYPLITKIRNKEQREKRIRIQQENT